MADPRRPVQPRTVSFDDIVKFFQKIDDVRNVDNLGAMIQPVRKFFREHANSTTEFLNRKALSQYKWTAVQHLAIGILLPLDENPKILSEYLGVILHEMVDLPPKYQVAIALKYVRASVLANQADTAIRNGPLRKLFDRSPVIYQLPMLMLTAHTPTPTVLELIPTTERRYDTILFYYSGVSKLLSAVPAQADQDFVHAWLLSKSAKELRTVIVNRMSLAAFLTGISEPVFRARVPAKYFPAKGAAAEIWNLTISSNEVVSKWEPLYQKLASLIRKERAKRLLANLAKVAEAMSIGEVRRICEFQGIEELTSPELQLSIRGDVVYFSQPKLGPRVDEEIERVANLAGARPK